MFVRILADTVVSGVVGEGGLQIPLLRDVFDKFQSMPINIDIKIDNDELIKKVKIVLLPLHKLANGSCQMCSVLLAFLFFVEIILVSQLSYYYKMWFTMIINIVLL